MIRVAAIQIDANTAAYVHPIDYLKEPVSFFQGRSGCGMSNLGLQNKEMKNVLNTFIQLEIIDKYIDYLNQKLERILLYCQAKKVNLAVFPEYSIPAQCLPHLHNLISNKTITMDVIAGSHAVTTENEPIYKKIGLPINLAEDLRKAISPILTSSGQVLHAEKLKASRGDLSITPGDFKGLFEIVIGQKRYKYLNLICIDFIADKDPEIIDGLRDSFKEADFVVVPAYTPRIDYFERSSLNNIWGYKKPTIFVNASDGGETMIFCHFDPPHILSDPYEHCAGSYQMPRGEEGIVIVDFNPDVQFTIQPTPLDMEEPSIQREVTPIIYPSMCNKYQEIKARYARKSITETIRILRDDEETIRNWGKMSEIFRDKISRLYLGLTNSICADEVAFYTEALVIDDESEIHMQIDEWREAAIVRIIKYLDGLLRRQRIRPKKDEERRILQIKNYYRDCLANIQTKDLFKAIKSEREKRRNRNTKILVCHTSKTSFFEYCMDILKKDGGYSVTTSADDNRLHPRNNQSFVSEFKDIKNNFTAILFLLSDEGSYVDVLANLSSDLKDKCILIYDNDIIKYKMPDGSKVTKELFYECIEFSGPHPIREEQGLNLDKIIGAIKRLSGQEDLDAA